MKYLRSRLWFLIGLNLLVLMTGLSGDDLGKAEGILSSAIQNNDLDRAKEAVRQISGANNEKAISILINRLPNSAEKYDFYWLILNGLPAFNDEKALEKLADVITGNKTKPLGQDALFILKSNQSAGMVKLLIRVLEKGSREQQGLALEHLGEIRTKTAVAALVDFLKQEICAKDDWLRRHAGDSLLTLVGDVVSPDAESVTKWWNEHQNDTEAVLFAKALDSSTQTGTAVDQLNYVRYSAYDRLKRLPKDKIIVITSDCKGCESAHRDMSDPEFEHNFDHMEKVLDKMGVPYTLVKKSEFDTKEYKIDDKIAILFNCNQIENHCINPQHHSNNQAGGARLEGDEGPGNCILYSNMLSKNGVEKIRDFIIGGGYFFSEDWIIKEVLTRAFKEKIISFKQYYPVAKDISILPAPGATHHPYLKGVFERVTAPAQGGSESNGTISVKRRELTVGSGKWKVDAASPDIRIDNPACVTVLMVSPDLKKKPEDSGAVVVTFAYGKNGPVPVAKIGATDDPKKKPGDPPPGQVLHVVSHFGKQSDASDEFVLQNLLLNFLIEGMERAPLRAKK